MLSMFIYAMSDCRTSRVLCSEPCSSHFETVTGAKPCLIFINSNHSPAELELYADIDQANSTRFLRYRCLHVFSKIYLPCTRWRLSCFCEWWAIWLQIWWSKQYYHNSLSLNSCALIRFGWVDWAILRGAPGLIDVHLALFHSLLAELRKLLCECCQNSFRNQWSRCNFWKPWAI